MKLYVFQLKPIDSQIVWILLFGSERAIERRAKRKKMKYASISYAHPHLFAKHFLSEVFYHALSLAFLYSMCVVYIEIYTSMYVV